MAGKPAPHPRCPQTGLAVPECSCKRCLEQMLREFSPDLLSGEIRVTKTRPEREARGGAAKPPRSDPAW